MLAALRKEQQIPLSPKIRHTILSQFSLRYDSMNEQVNIPYVPQTISGMGVYVHPILYILLSTFHLFSKNVQQLKNKTTSCDKTLRFCIFFGKVSRIL